MTMPTYSTAGHIIQLRQTGGLGSNWIVRVFRKRPLLRKLISSDWFLDESQARRFVDELRGSLEREETARLLAERKPGWVLRRPNH